VFEESEFPEDIRKIADNKTIKEELARRKIN
jgi:hypothetical protein